MKARKKVNELTGKTMQWMDTHPTHKKFMVGTVVGIGLVAIGYLLGNRKGKSDRK